MNELPTTPGYYVADCAVVNGDPYGAVVFLLDEDYGWGEMPGMHEDGELETRYGQDVEAVLKKMPWKMIRLVPEDPVD